MEKKKCTACKGLFDKTEQFFFIQNSKQKRADGKIKIYTSFRSNCKQCWIKNSRKKARQKRCKELGVSMSQYKQAANQQRALSKYKNKELIGVPKSLRHHIRDKIKNGYIYKGLEQWENDVELSIRKAQLKHRKYNYQNKGRLTSKEINRACIIRLSNAVIANRLRHQRKSYNKKEY